MGYNEQVVCELITLILYTLPNMINNYIIQTFVRGSDIVKPEPSLAQA